MTEFSTNLTFDKQETVRLAHRVAGSSASASDELEHALRASSIDLVVEARSSVGGSLVLAAEESDDGDSWSEIEAIGTLARTGSATLTVTPTKEWLRVAWEGGSGWTIDITATGHATIEAGNVGTGNGGSLPINVDWDENDLNIHEAFDSGPLTPSLFRLKTLLSGGLQLSVRVASFFAGDLTTYNDNGDELFESDSLANGGVGEVRINGTPFSAVGIQQGGPLTEDLDADGNGFTDVASVVGATGGSGRLSITGPSDGVGNVELTAGVGIGAVVAVSTDGIHLNSDAIAFFGDTPTIRPTGVAVDVTAIHTALVSLGLITA